MKSDHNIYKNLILLRLLVGYLGEKRQCNWWDTGFLDSTGRRFLESTFPRTVLPAALRSTTEAARIVHDTRIGRIGAYHLFRLPVDQEDFLEAHINDFLETTWADFLSGKETALDELARLKNGTGSKSDGPIQIGNESAILKDSSVAQLAGHYHAAFFEGFQCYPYFGKDKK